VQSGTRKPTKKALVSTLSIQQESMVRLEALLNGQFLRVHPTATMQCAQRLLRGCNQVFVIAFPSHLRKGSARLIKSPIVLISVTDLKKLLHPLTPSSQMAKRGHFNILNQLNASRKAINYTNRQTIISYNFRRINILKATLN